MAAKHVSRFAEHFWFTSSHTMEKRARSTAEKVDVGGIVAALEKFFALQQQRKISSLFQDLPAAQCNLPMPRVRVSVCFPMS